MAGMVPPHREARMRIVRHPHTKQPIDQALVLYFKAPASETGEDIAELQIHGGRAVIAATLAALGAIPGCRMAAPGEFARRAFDNGKLDLTAAEGLIDLIDAETEAQRAQALDQAAGALSKLYDGWRHSMIEAQALVEAAIDFADEGDVTSGVYQQARTSATALRNAIEQHLQLVNKGEILRTGFQVVLTGAPNAGKSSLLNALAKRDAAIVSEEAGTTRDIIEVRLDLDGIPVVVSDTAGVRNASGAVEREGIRRTLARAKDADLVLWLVDATDPQADLPAELRAERCLLVVNKVDINAAGLSTAAAHISAKTGEGIDQLATLIATKARDALGTATAPAPTQERHRHHLLRALEHIDAFLEGSEAQLELRAEDLRLAATELGRLTGRIDPEEVLGQIFGRFCIGK
jgi:tRNA modification GTPase